MVATSGDTQFGGTDMDRVLIEYIIKGFKRQSGIDLTNDSMATQGLREAAEKAKVELSSALTTDINLPFISADASGAKHLTLSINRAKLEELIGPIMERCRGPLEQALKDAADGFAKQGGRFSSDDIEKIIMVGGPTRMPAVQNFETLTCLSFMIGDWIAGTRDNRLQPVPMDRGHANSYSRNGGDITFFANQS